MIDHKIYNLWHDENNIAREMKFGQKYGSLEDPLANGYFRESSVIYHYKNGKVHREDGPAVEHLISEYKEWRFKGVKINCNSQGEFEKIIKLKAFI